MVFLQVGQFKMRNIYSSLNSRSMIYIDNIDTELNIYTFRVPSTATTPLQIEAVDYSFSLVNTITKETVSGENIIVSCTEPYYLFTMNLVGLKEAEYEYTLSYNGVELEKGLLSVGLQNKQNETTITGDVVYNG